MKPFTRLTGPAAPLTMANVDTDKIVPSRFLKTVSKAGLADALFADLRKNPDFILNQPGRTEAQILVALENFGCGSSREHAPWALAAFGIRCVIAPSFAEIFQNNCRNNGILTVTLPGGEIADLLVILGDPSTSELSVDLPEQTILAQTGRRFDFDIAPAHKTYLLEGLNEIDRTMERDDQITAFETAHRRAQPWLSTPLKA